MRRPVVAVDTIHDAPRHGILGCVPGLEDLDLPVGCRQLHIVDGFARLVGTIANLYVRIDVPVDAGGFASREAADLEQNGGLQRRILFVVHVHGLDFEKVTDVSGRPVALFAGFARRAQVMDGCRDRRRVKVESYRHHLPRAGQLGLDEPVGAGADMTIGAGNARMR